MKITSKEIQLQYEGFLQTACLWKNNAVYNLKQFKIEQKPVVFNQEIDTKQRLGKYIERFVSYELENNKNIEIIAENIQIQQEKITLGELDCIIKIDEKYIHLEVIYKFYLYDALIGDNEIKHFIGPNRKDALVAKLDKLKSKQLPLLYSKECETYLSAINLSSKEMEQQVYFKAQLFVPLSNKKLKLDQLNHECIAGFYIHQKELFQFEDCKFYIPTKKNWLIVPHKNVNWMCFYQFKEKGNEYLERKFSPLCWMKRKNGATEKFFFVWW